ncbi:hypothetical protein [Hydrogenophaga pseudoflava]|uniref:hypothetical protein n=1 Tax=Hydrogenophaga pseudoflava TaxID=47421 RepID=UPI0008267FB7|nr:hypothetical protein [Hydrogenophaga pseudoflava]
MSGTQTKQNAKARQVPALCQGPRYFDPSTLTEEEAGDLWTRCMAAIAAGQRERRVPGLIRVRHRPAELITLYGRTGRLERFWLRTLAFNHLVIVGNREGLLPLDVGSIHG